MLSRSSNWDILFVFRQAQSLSGTERLTPLCERLCFFPFFWTTVPLQATVELWSAYTAPRLVTMGDRKQTEQLTRTEMINGGGLF